MFNLDEKNSAQVIRVLSRKETLNVYDLQYLSKMLKSTAGEIDEMICKQSLQEVIDAAANGDPFNTPERAAKNAMIALSQMVNR